MTEPMDLLVLAALGQRPRTAEELAADLATPLGGVRRRLSVAQSGRLARPGPLGVWEVTERGVLALREAGMVAPEVVAPAEAPEAVAPAEAPEPVEPVEAPTLEPVLHPEPPPHIVADLGWRVDVRGDGDVADGRYLVVAVYEDGGRCRLAVRRGDGEGSHYSEAATRTLADGRPLDAEWVYDASVTAAYPPTAAEALAAAGLPTTPPTAPADDVARWFAQRVREDAPPAGSGLTLEAAARLLAAVDPATLPRGHGARAMLAAAAAWVESMDDDRALAGRVL